MPARLSHTLRKTSWTIPSESSLFFRIENAKRYNLRLYIWKSLSNAFTSSFRSCESSFISISEGIERVMKSHFQRHRNIIKNRLKQDENGKKEIYFKTSGHWKLLYVLWNSLFIVSVAFISSVRSWNENTDFRIEISNNSWIKANISSLILQIFCLAELLII